MTGSGGVSMVTENTPTREEIIELCERGFTLQSNWRNRDSAGAHRQLGEAHALLKAGCDYTIIRKSRYLSSDAKTWWVAITFHGFDAFEYGRDCTETETFYIPTADRLAGRPGQDWY